MSGRVLDRAVFAGRAAAFEAISQVVRRHVPLDEALDPSGLAERDRAFARALASGTLRRQGEVDALLGTCLERPLPRKAAPVLDLLRLGAFQIVYLGVPAHAAVDTAVEMVAALGYPGFKKLVNAVLRRLARDGADLAVPLDGPRLNTPDWLWQSWQVAYGEEACRAIAAANMTEAPLDLTLRDGAEAPVWAERLGARILPTGSLRLTEAGQIDQLPGFAEGAWWVQDAAAALPARLLAGPPGQRLVDLCAAPGGKTAQLAADGARVVALDRSPHRLVRLAGNLARLGLAAELHAADAELWRPAELQDGVLLDAPCSATGTLRRHPDIAASKQERDVAALAAAQSRLLVAAASMVRPGGLLVYCTCSLQPEEGEARIEAFLGQGGWARRPVAAEEVGGLAELITPAGDLRSLPCHLSEKGGMDGFYAARLVKG